MAKDVVRDFLTRIQRRGFSTSHVARLTAAELHELWDALGYASTPEVREPLKECAGRLRQRANHVHCLDKAQGGPPVCGSPAFARRKRNCVRRFVARLSLKKSDIAITVTPPSPTVEEPLYEIDPTEKALPECIGTQTFLRELHSLGMTLENVLKAPADEIGALLDLIGCGPELKETVQSMAVQHKTGLDFNVKMKSTAHFCDAPGPVELPFLRNEPNDLWIHSQGRQVSRFADSQPICLGDRQFSSYAEHELSLPQVVPCPVDGLDVGHETPPVSPLIPSNTDVLVSAGSLRNLKTSKTPSSHDIDATESNPLSWLKSLWPLARTRKPLRALGTRADLDVMG